MRNQGFPFVHPDTNSIINSKSCYSKESENKILNSANIKNRLVLAQLNINSLRYKFDSLKSLVKDKSGLLVVTETKLDESFPSTQFSIDGFSKPVRLDRLSQGRGGRGGGYNIYSRKHFTQSA